MPRTISVTIGGHFDFLVNCPELATKRYELKQGSYSYFERSHTIYYKIINNQVAIMDILDQSMEPKSNLRD